MSLMSAKESLSLVGLFHHCISMAVPGQCTLYADHKVLGFFLDYRFGFFCLILSFILKEVYASKRLNDNHLHQR